MRTGMMVLGVAALALAGCSETGGDDGLVPPGQGFQAVLAEGDAIYAERAGLGYTDPASLPTEGRARFEGVIGLVGPGSALAPSGSIIGDLALNVDFSADQGVTGTADGFVTADDVAIDGAVIFDQGEIERGADPTRDYTFAAITAHGALVAPGGETFVVEDGYLQGDFFGATPSHAAGPAHVRLSPESGAPDFYMEGGYEARRN